MDGVHRAGTCSGSTPPEVVSGRASPRTFGRSDRIGGMAKIGIQPMSSTISPDDEELKPDWLDRLFSLNSVVAAKNEPLAGNLFYRDRQEDFVRRPADPVYRAKRDRLRSVARRSGQMLEIGVNGGHSAFMALTSNPQLEFHGIDICEHAYVEPAVSWLEREFPGRVNFYRGDSLEVVPSLSARGMRFDLFHVDGAKFNYFDDIVNCSCAAEPSGSLLVVDDAQTMAARVALASLALFVVVRSLPEFPAMSDSHANRNEIKRIVPTSVPKVTALKAYSRLLTLVHEVKIRAWHESDWARATHWP
jgi:predicted O-methyltransferase YrrM